MALISLPFADVSLKNQNLDIVLNDQQIYAKSFMSVLSRFLCVELNWTAPSLTMTQLKSRAQHLIVKQLARGVAPIQLLKLIQTDCQLFHINGLLPMSGFFSMFSFKRPIYNAELSKYIKFHWQTLQTHKNMRPLTCQFRRYT